MTDHVTPVLEAPVTVEVNCCVEPGATLTVAGLTETVMGVKVNEAEPQTAASITLQAFTAMFCAVAIGLGAVYKPVASIVPISGEMDHVTPMLL
jgi:hypothetical protein